MTQDWHTPGHISFASSAFRQEAVRDRRPDLRQAGAVARPLRAGHRRRCAVEGSRDPACRADHPQGLSTRTSTAIRPSPRLTARPSTGLAAYLKARKLQRVFIAGLATDFCVAWTALDARKAGFDVYVIEDACRGIDTQGSLAKAWADMNKAGVKRIQSRRSWRAVTRSL